jgi:hypothetical protein
MCFMTLAGVAALLMSTAIGITAAGTQTPQPFPRPAAPAPQQPPPAAPQPPGRSPGPTQPGVPRPDPNAPTEAQLGLPIYPAAQFIASYDAGRGQRFYIFGTTASFAEMVAYYRTYLKERGDFVFEEPPTHMFEVGRFREETMAFPPGITVKDYTWGGSKGYPNPKPGAQPERVPTILMLVPPPPGTPPGL